jgi:hypothetical protein
MAKASSHKSGSHSLLKTLWNTASVLISGTRPLIHQLLDGLDGQLDHYARIIEKRLVILALLGFMLFLSVFFIWFGLLFIVMDYGGLPRAFACLCCGSFGLIVLVLIVLLGKQNRSAS